jgi:histidinol-phosphatase (PHP family)
VAADLRYETIVHVLPADNHVHSEFSYDTTAEASMTRSCEQALAVGVPSVAFTEHMEFTTSRPGDAITVDQRWWKRIRPFDVDGYMAAVAASRERYPDLRILSGVEAGEPHLFAASAAAVVSGRSFDRILGSLHAVPYDGALVPADRQLFSRMPSRDAMRLYFAEIVRLIEGSDLFEVLAHVDFPRRYWPEGPGEYREAAFQEEYRAVFRALADSDRVLEINTKSPLASVELVRWWRDEGGRACSFGSDAHVPGRVGDRFKLAVDIVEAAGFRPGRDQYDFWRRLCP